ncbi:hypothetical protein DPSP01_009842 [Paraphaeosphaeria sporulosa]|uniref:Acid protease n=1 Tax=Paraphaeosphaeria sporulosa TaxID=1460663 RepID=A0A177BWA8_9PLEO|nr:acid protease [Paraphaeosphaeria sporulosa]OAF98656.1 acid protease [Paraphaeosphaeria sporulosa]
MPSQQLFVRFVFITLLLSWTSSTSFLPTSHRRSLHEKLLETRRNPKLLQREVYHNPHHDAVQAHLSDPGLTKLLTTNAKKTAVLEVARVDVFGLPFYMANFAFGTPPQPFAMLIDLGYGGAVVRSVDCPTHHHLNDCGQRVFAYNHSVSSTSNDMGLRFSVGLGGQTAQGSLFGDTMHIVSLQVQNATLGAIDVFYGENLLLEILAEFCDGAIGLARPNQTSSSYYDVQSRPNVLYELRESGVLARDVMTLSLPKRNNDRGSLTLGEEPPPAKYRIALSEASEIGEGWIVDLGGIYFNGTTIPLNISYTASAAITLEPAFAIALPNEIVHTIFDYLGAHSSEDGEGGIIDCKLRESLPDLTLTLGGQTVTFPWWQYTGVWWYDGRPYCLVEIQPTWGDEGGAVLGLPLLRNFDLSFDMDRNEIGLIES